MKIKESEKINKYFDFARELKKKWNIRARVIPVVVVALGTDTKGSEKELEELKIRRRNNTL